MATNLKDPGGIVKAVYDPTSESINVNLVGSGSPSLPSSVRLADGSGYLTTTNIGGIKALDVVVKAMPALVIDSITDSITIGDSAGNHVTTQVNGAQRALDVGINVAGVQVDPRAIRTLTSNDIVTSIDGLKSGGVAGSVTLTTASTAYEAKVGGSRLTNRKLLSIISNDNTLFWGYNNTVTAASGMPLLKGQQIDFSCDPTDSNFQVWLVSTFTGITTRISESP